TPNNLLYRLAVDMKRARVFNAIELFSFQICIHSITTWNWKAQNASISTPHANFSHYLKITLGNLLLAPLTGMPGSRNMFSDKMLKLVGV
ncbi:hypothetical protein VIGAN_03074800, partial [Vigna angularis var. angularis]